MCNVAIKSGHNGKPNDPIGSKMVHLSIGFVFLADQSSLHNDIRRKNNDYSFFLPTAYNRAHRHTLINMNVCFIGKHICTNTATFRCKPKYPLPSTDC